MMSRPKGHKMLISLSHISWTSSTTSWTWPGRRFSPACGVPGMGNFGCSNGDFNTSEDVHRNHSIQKCTWRVLSIYTLPLRIDQSPLILWKEVLVTLQWSDHLLYLSRKEGRVPPTNPCWSSALVFSFATCLANCRCITTIEYKKCNSVCAGYPIK